MTPNSPASTPANGDDRDPTVAPPCRFVRRARRYNAAIVSATKLILASRSPRRAAILETVGLAFEVVDPPYDDPPEPDDQDPVEMVRQRARAKAKSVWQHRRQGGDADTESVILAADTVVIGPDESLMGQPSTRDEAEAMLRTLIGATHRVATAVCIIDPVGEAVEFDDVAEVRIGVLARQTLEEYLDSEQWRGKAGGYNYAELFRDWPIHVTGAPTTVIGLPVRRVVFALQEMGIAVLDTDPALNHPATDGPSSPAILAPLTWPYRGAVAMRNAMFDHRLRRAKPLGRPTISIGNLTTGGTGKTPMVIETVRRLRQRGHAPAVLLRGYKAGPTGSDEATLLTDTLADDATVHPNPSRVAAAEAALAERPAITCFVLDDGFQHRQAARDVDLVLIDATFPFGGDRLLPWGRLREPVRALRRADGVFVTRADQVAPAVLESIDRTIQQACGRAADGRVAMRWDHLLDAEDRAHSLEVLSGQAAIAACGIGNPESFRAAAAAHAGEVTLREFADHHAFSAAEVGAILSEARQCGAVVLVTEKDWVKWRALGVDFATGPAVYRAVVRPAFLTGEQAFDDLLARLGDPRR